VNNTILANNGASEFQGAVFNGGGAGGGGGADLIGNPGNTGTGTSGATLFAFTGGSSNANPGLDPGGLNNNGGPTQTFALLTGSPAIDAGIKAGAPATDQRGYVRDSDITGNVDIGAYEYLLPDVASIAENDGVLADMTNFSNQLSMITHVVITFNSQVALTGTPIAVNFRDVASPGWNEDLKPLVIDDTSGHTVVTVTFQHVSSPDPVTGGSLQDGNYKVIVTGSGVHQVGTGNLVMADYSSPFYRWFGDLLGDKPVGNADALWFRKTFNLSSGNPGFIAAFDYDGAVTIGNLAALQFRKRFNTSPPLPTFSMVVLGPLGTPSTLLTVAAQLNVPPTIGAALPAVVSQPATMSAVDAFFQKYGAAAVPPHTDVVPGLSVVSASDASKNNELWQSALDAAYAGLTSL
jgi:hypothetical protein